MRNASRSERNQIYIFIVDGDVVYFSSLIDHSPACAPQLVDHQRIITSACAQYPLTARLKYDIQLRTLAVSYPSHIK